MRLTCPNCTAQYEIDASLIPDDGRDVQCSNCSNTWFATKPVPPAPAPAPVDVDWDAAVEDDDDDIVEEDAPTAEDRSPEPAWQESVSAPEPTPAAVSDRQRRPVDPDAMDILREEAGREMAQRQGEPAPIETQSEAALEDDIEDEVPSRAWKARVSRIEDAEEIEQRARELDEKAAYSQPKSDLLPDIENINSSLAPGVTSGGSGSFRTGFALFFGIAVLLLALYSLAPMLARTFPATEGFFVAYLDAANAARALIGGG